MPNRYIYKLILLRATCSSESARMKRDKQTVCASKVGPDDGKGGVEAEAEGRCKGRGEGSPDGTFTFLSFAFAFAFEFPSAATN